MLNRPMNVHSLMIGTIVMLSLCMLNISKFLILNPDTKIPLVVIASIKRRLTKVIFTRDCVI